MSVRVNTSCRDICCDRSSVWLCWYTRNLSQEFSVYYFVLFLSSKHWQVLRIFAAWYVVDSAVTKKHFAKYTTEARYDARWTQWSWTLLIELWFYVPTRHKIGHFGDVPQANLLAWYRKTKPNTTKARIHQSKEMYYNTKNKHTRKLKPGLVTSYAIQPGNWEGLFWFWRFINWSLTYLETCPLTYSPGTHMGKLNLWYEVLSMWAVQPFTLINSLQCSDTAGQATATSTPKGSLMVHVKR